MDVREVIFVDLPEKDDVGAAARADAADAAAGTAAARSVSATVFLASPADEFICIRLSAVVADAKEASVSTR